MSNRYYVFKVSGYALAASSSGGRSNAPPPVAYYVYDRDYCHRIVAVFPPGDVWPARGYRVEKAQREAEGYCAELNGKGVVRAA